MGYFTWTDARKQPRTLPFGGYYTADKVSYDGYAKVVCPDNSEIVELCYEGYGRFDGKDVLELVVDWNKEYLKEIFDNVISNKHRCHLKDIAIAYQNDNLEEINKQIDYLISTGKEPRFFKKDWKRSIGIAISCYDNEKLPFPIKITSLKTHKKYNELFPSFSCQ